METHKNDINPECFTNQIIEKSLIRRCINCSKDMTNARYKSGKLKLDTIFCSLQCDQEYRRKKIDKLIESDVVVGIVAMEGYLLRKYDSTCQGKDCGWNIPNPNTGKSCLGVHHIDGNSKNNRLSNVELLCPNCHSLTPNYKNIKRASVNKNDFI